MYRLFLMQFLIVIVVALLACEGDQGPVAPAAFNWLLEPDSTNVGILVVDYTTERFEGGFLRTYPPCTECTNDSLPLSFTFVSHTDGLELIFTYEQTGDTVLYVTEVWMGTGMILYPPALWPADTFKVLWTPFYEPVHTEYYDMGWPDETQYMTRSEAAWQSLRELDLVGAFAQNPYTVGVFLYTPAVGVIDPEKAKWIFMLYQNRITIQPFFSL